MQPASLPIPIQILSSKKRWDFSAGGAGIGDLQKAKHNFELIYCILDSLITYEHYDKSE